MSAAIGNPASIVNAPAPQANSGFAQLSSGEFMKIIISELSNQDPLAPNDTAAILEQLSSIRNIESQAKLEDKLDALVTQNAIASGSQMIGSVVKGLDANNNRLEGLVDSLVMQDGKPVLKLVGGKQIAADRVTEVASLNTLQGPSVQRLLMDLQALDSSKLVGMDVGGQVLNAKGKAEYRSGTVAGVTLADGQITLELKSGKTMPLANVTNFGKVARPTSATASPAAITNTAPAS